MTKRTYAKINFGLRVISRREDGYHDIETIFYRVNPYDVLTFEAAPTISITSTDLHLAIDESNLCMRAVRSVQKYFQKETAGVHIHLIKNIPAGAGLGGGSSDTAATLLALTELWNIAASLDELRTLAGEIGSDVPYFLLYGTASATGRGDVLQYFHFDLPYWIVLVYPNIHVSTAWAYQHVRLTGQGHQRPLKDILEANINNPSVLRATLQNDFEPIVFPVHAVIGSIKQAHYDAGAVFALMSGSGSSVYGLYTEENLALAAVTEFQKQYRVFVTPPHFHPT